MPSPHCLLTKCLFSRFAFPSGEQTKVLPESGKRRREEVDPNTALFNIEHHL
jgi:hypothetical protein